MTNKEKQLQFQKRFGGEIKGKWLVFSGNLNCSNNQLTSLPDNLKVGGGLYCYNNQLKLVPEYIKKIKYCYIFQGLNWNDPVWINRILKDELTAEEVFAIDNIEHRRIAYEYMDKSKMKQLKDFKVLDKKKDNLGKTMRIVSFTVQKMKEPLIFYNCFDASTDREYWLQMDGHAKCDEAKADMWGLKNIEFIKEW